MIRKPMISPAKKLFQNHPYDLARRLMRITPCMVHAMVSALRERGDGDANTMMQVHTLRALSEGPRTFKELCAFRRVAPPTLSRSIDAMVRRGWIERVPHPDDRRQLLLKLTPGGQHEFEAIQGQVEMQLATQLSALSDRELRTLADGLDVLAKALCVPEFESLVPSESLGRSKTKGRG